MRLLHEVFRVCLALLKIVELSEQMSGQHLVISWYPFAYPRPTDQ